MTSSNTSLCCNPATPPTTQDAPRLQPRPPTSSPHYTAHSPEPPIHSSAQNTPFERHPLPVLKSARHKMWAAPAHAGSILDVCKINAHPSPGSPLLSNQPSSFLADKKEFWNSPGTFFHKTHTHTHRRHVFPQAALPAKICTAVPTPLSLMHTALCPPAKPARCISRRDRWGGAFASTASFLIATPRISPQLCEGLAVGQADEPGGSCMHSSRAQNYGKTST